MWLTASQKSRKLLQKLMSKMNKYRQHNKHTSKLRLTPTKLTFLHVPHTWQQRAKHTVKVDKTKKKRHGLRGRQRCHNVHEMMRLQQCPWKAYLADIAWCTAHSTVFLTTEHSAASPMQSERGIPSSWGAAAFKPPFCIQEQVCIPCQCRRSKRMAHQMVQTMLLTTTFNLSLHPVVSPEDQSTRCAGGCVVRAKDDVTE